MTRSRAAQGRLGVRWLGMCLAGLMLAAVSCESKRSSGAALPVPSPVVDVGMREYGFVPTGQFPAGQVVFMMKNKGKIMHSAALFALPEGLPPLKEQLEGSQRRPIERFAGTPALPAGVGNSFVADLAPGQRYGLICFVSDPDGKSHALKGMFLEFKTPGPKVPALVPAQSPPASPSASAAPPVPAAATGSPPDGSGPAPSAGAAPTQP